MGRDFKKMDIWHISYQLVLDIYPLLNEYPDFEHRNLVDQIRRAVTSLPLNIAEGAGCHSNKVFLTYLGYAYKSAKELDVLLLLSRDLCYLENDVYDVLQQKLEEFKAKTYKFLCQVEKEIVQHRPNFNYYRPDIHESAESVM